VNVVVVCLGKELGVEDWLANWNRMRKQGNTPNTIEAIELCTNQKYGKFFTHKPAKILRTGVYVVGTAVQGEGDSFAPRSGSKIICFWNRRKDTPNTTKDRDITLMSAARFLILNSECHEFENWTDRRARLTARLLHGAGSLTHLLADLFNFR